MDDVTLVALVAGILAAPIWESEGHPVRSIGEAVNNAAEIVARAKDFQVITPWSVQMERARINEIAAHKVKACDGPGECRLCDAEGVTLP